MFIRPGVGTASGYSGGGIASVYVGFGNSSADYCRGSSPANNGCSYPSHDGRSHLSANDGFGESSANANRGGLSANDGTSNAPANYCGSFSSANAQFWRGKNRGCFFIRQRVLRQSHLGASNYVYE